MKSTILVRDRVSFAIAGVLFSLMLTACGSGAGSKVDSRDANASSNNNASSAVVVGSPGPATTDPRTVDAQPVASQPNNNNRQVSGVTKPQLGTGGSDFFLFTQARAALGSDVDLKTANIIIEAHGGVVTLSGTVANASQKAKAEQLVRAVAGVKGVKNQLRISG